MPQEAVLLIGGLGTRLRPLTLNVPKPMLPIGDKPFLEYLVLFLKNQGVRRFILAMAHRSEVVTNYFGNGKRWGIEMLYSDPQGQQLGTGGAIRFARQLIEGKQFFALNGDVYFNASLNKLWEFHQHQQAIATLALAKVEDFRRYGSVILNAQNRIERFLEKNSEGAAQEGLINGGIYIFEQSIFDYMPNNAVVSLEHDVFPKLAGKSLWGVAFAQAHFIDIGTPQDYERAQQLIPGLGAVT